MDSKLEDSWSGPLEVVAKLSAVNYRIRATTGKGKARVAHINQ